MHIRNRHTQKTQSKNLDVNGGFDVNFLKGQIHATSKFSSFKTRSKYENMHFGENR